MQQLYACMCVCAVCEIDRLWVMEFIKGGVWTLIHDWATHCRANVSILWLLAWENIVVIMCCKSCVIKYIHIHCPGQNIVACLCKSVLVKSVSSRYRSTQKCMHMCASVFLIHAHLVQKYTETGLSPLENGKVKKGNDTQCESFVLYLVAHLFLMQSFSPLSALSVLVSLQFLPLVVSRPLQ